VLYVFNVGIRHPEELSLARKMDREELKKNKGISATRRTQIPGLAATNGHYGGGGGYESGTMGSPYRSGNGSTPQVVIYNYFAKIVTTE